MMEEVMINGVVCCLIIGYWLIVVGEIGEL